MDANKTESNPDQNFQRSSAREHWASFFLENRARITTSDEILLQVIAQTLGMAIAIQIARNWLALRLENTFSLMDFLRERAAIPVIAQRVLALTEKNFVSVNELARFIPFEKLLSLSNESVPASLDAGTSPPRSEDNTMAQARKVEAKLFPREISPEPRDTTTARANADTVFSSTKLGKYVLMGLIGEGGFGRVYRSVHPTLKIPVALKVLRSNLESCPAAVLRQFALEARLLAQLNHPNVVRIWDYDNSESPPFVVLEYVEGQTLSHLIRLSGRFDWRHACRIIRQVAEGLAAAQAVGICHRDVKPDNILISNKGVAKIADFGLASLAEERVRGPTLHSSYDAVVAGTVEYMAPELLGDNYSDHRADIYSLGVTFYQTVTGKLPFVGNSPINTLIQHAKSTPVTPLFHASDLPVSICRLILRMMAKQPQQRIQTYEEIISTLTQEVKTKESSIFPRFLGFFRRGAEKTANK